MPFAKKQNMSLQPIWNSASEIAPAIGLIGTIIGLIQLFATGIDPLKMGPAMSFTLLTSLYGLVRFAHNRASDLCPPKGKSRHIE